MSQYSKNNKVSLRGLKTSFNGKWFVLLFFGVMLLSTIRCANIQQPTGGPIDSIPPVLLNEFPANLSTYFTDRDIVLTFDEFIRLNNPQREVSISPDMDQFPEIRARRRQVEITLPDSLAENTTYVINFGDAIADNNEGNPYKNYSYVFSTGAQIDSLSISGQVISAETNRPEFQASVLLIPVSQDSIFGKRKANIFATTDSSGYFKLNYLREDEYRIYALRELNNDRIYNSPEESIGFIDHSILLQGDTANVLLWTSKQVPDEFRVLDRIIEPNGQITLKFNRPLEEPRVEITSPDSLNLNKRVQFNSNRDSALIWVSHLTFDSIKMNIHNRDSLIDSIVMRRPSNDRYTRTILISDNLNRNRVNNIKHIELNASIPMRQVNRSNIELTEDSVRISNFQLIQDSLNDRKATIRYNWKPEKNYVLTLQQEAFVGYFGEGNDLTRIQFTLDEGDRYGHLSFNFNVPDTNAQYIVQLMDEEEKIIHQTDYISGQTNIVYRNYLEGKYKIRVIYDENGNRRWDPGNMENNIQPERIWYYDKTFNIRPNWEQEENITIPALSTSRQILPIR